MIPDFRNIAYLADGTSRQQALHQVLHELYVFELLRRFDPVCVSTICIDLDLPDSDVDVICEFDDEILFTQTLRDVFGTQPEFVLWRRPLQTGAAVVASFQFDSFRFEIYGERRPVEEQNAYRHLVSIARLLSLAGDEARAAIRDFKRGGMKTEPAVKAYFEIDGDPYQILYDLADRPEAHLRELVTRAPGRVSS